MRLNEEKARSFNTTTIKVYLNYQILKKIANSPLGASTAQLNLIFRY